MTKIFITLGLLFSISSFAGNGGGTCHEGDDGHGGCGGDKWPAFKADCESHGGYATPIPNKCAAYKAGAATHDQITYTSIPDGSSGNEKCCIKCNSPVVATSEAKCGTSDGSVWLPAPANGCCFKTNTNTATAVSVTTAQIVVRRSCMRPYATVVTTTDINPVPTTSAACATAGFHWMLNACCK